MSQIHLTRVVKIMLLSEGNEFQCHRCKKRFLRFLFFPRFLRFLTFFIFANVFYYKKRYEFQAVSSKRKQGHTLNFKKM
jgi:hypothetical protein